MGAGILNLVTNTGPQNRWINQDPQITFFKTIYRRHTPFAMESIPLSFNTKLDFGDSGTIRLLPLGDLAHRMCFTFDIPKLAARFLKTKSQDIAQMIHSLVMTDNEFSTMIKKFAIDDKHIELDQIFNLIEDQLDKYDYEQDCPLNVLDSLEKYKGSIESNLKIDLANQWISQKKEYFLIHELLKLIYFSEKTVIDCTPLVDAASLPNTLIEDHIFHNLLPNKEILLSFYLNSKGMPSNDFIQYDNLDTHCLLKKILNQQDAIQNYFYEFGPDFYHMLNSYNTIISVVNSLAITVPIVVSKVYALDNNCCNRCNIYTNNLPTFTKRDVYFPTIIDPNFKANYMLNVNNLEKPIENDFFVPINFTSMNDISGYPNKYINSYLTLFNTEANTMFINVQKFVDILFERYRTKLFCSTDRLFFNNSPPLSNIYSYLAPTDGFKDDSNLKISNVFNTNIWYFYFFKYLDTLSESSFTLYVKNEIITTLSQAGMLFMKNLITLLKINIEYYMHEISYLLNDLYASSPSVHPSDNMKNYVPSTHNTVINGVNICDDLMAVTIIFHRSHVPSILEIFQFIYHFIETMDTNRINNYLGLDIPEIDSYSMSRIRSVIKLLYYQIFGYFMDVYDSFHFEPAANFSTNEFNPNDNIAIKQYVRCFLNGNTSVIYNS